jgi:hypothetical protein
MMAKDTMDYSFDIAELLNCYIANQHKLRPANNRAAIFEQVPYRMTRRMDEIGKRLGARSAPSLFPINKSQIVIL